MWWCLKTKKELCHLFMISKAIFNNIKENKICVHSERQIWTKYKFPQYNIVTQRSYWCWNTYYFCANNALAITACRIYKRCAPCFQTQIDIFRQYWACKQAPGIRVIYSLLLRFPFFQNQTFWILLKFYIIFSC